MHVKQAYSTCLNFLQKRYKLEEQFMSFGQLFVFKDIRLHNVLLNFTKIMLKSKFKKVSLSLLKCLIYCFHGRCTFSFNEKKPSLINNQSYECFSLLLYEKHVPVHYIQLIKVRNRKVRMYLFVHSGRLRGDNSTGPTF